MNNLGGANLKKVAVPILMFVLMVAGCARPAVNTTMLPLAYIDTVSSSQIYVGESIKFTGHGVSSIGQIVSYKWRSSVNGEISQLATFDTTTLTAGPHSIWFSVQDSYGNWSQEVNTNINVLAQGGPVKMSIKTFIITPPVITEGESALLTWEVQGSGTVRIDPDIGGVSLSGSRSIRPSKDTEYTIFGTNDVGISQVTAKITVSAVHVYTLTAYSIPAEDGTVRKDRVALEEVLVGENEMQVQMQGFLSFDISSIPRNAVIKSVELDLSKTAIVNSPFPWQGSLNIYNQQYGNTLNGNDYMAYTPANFLYSLSYNFNATMMPDKPLTSPEFVIAVQRQYDAGSNRFQLRLQFEKYYYYSRIDYTDKKYQPGMSNANYINVEMGYPKLTVRYVLPE